MKGNVKGFDQFIEGRKIQFIIPVYQRNYDWKISNCDQLFSDLVELSHSGRRSHFFGSIVTASADRGYSQLVIDGQQRITTISLLILAGLKAVKDGLLEIRDERNLRQASEVFLMADFCDSERKIKLVPIENDRIAYDKIINGADTYEESSKVTLNFRHFYELLTRKPQALTFDQLLDAIERLEIISIELDRDDDAQLIFESLNSTGLALTEADKIRNYLLMALTAEEQQTCFKEYWQKIEEATESEPTSFLRDYLTIKQQRQRPVRIPDMYPEWKKYMEGHDRKVELAEMLEYAHYYHQVTRAELSTLRLSSKMRHICNIESDLSNVFFIQFLKYADENGLPEDEIYKTIDVVENFLARRIVCGIPSNALTAVFCALHKDVMKSIEEYKAANAALSETYSDILAFHIMRRDGNYQMPRDDRFIEAIKTRDAYHMLKSFLVFLFERLENSVHGEYNDVARDMKTGDATIEHIMPQTLNGEWKAMLGDKYEEIQEKYLHTFANLTLTGINGELSNKAFEVKREGSTVGNEIYPGYKDSKYRLTRKVTECAKWTEAEILQRCQDITNTFLRLYPLPKPTFKPLQKPIDEVYLDDETFVPTNKNLRGYRLFGNEYAEICWKDMIVNVVKLVAEKNADIVNSLCDAGRFFWSEQEAAKWNMRCLAEFAPQKYVWIGSNKSKLRCLHYLFEKCDIAETELVMLIEPESE